MPTVLELRAAEFDARQTVRELRRAVFDGHDRGRMAELVAAERTLQQISDARAAAEQAEGEDDGSIVSVAPAANLLGPATTGLEVEVKLRMSAVPTALVHLYQAERQPLVSYRVVNNKPATKRLRLVSYVEGYSAHAVNTIEVQQLVPAAVDQLPTFFPDRINALTEVTRATLNVEVQDLDARTEVHETIPVWLMARTSAPLQVKDPSTGTWQDLTRFLGAFVTPNAPALMAYLRAAVDKHPHRRLVGYQVGEAEVTTEVQAVYEALAETGVTYVNSIIDFTPEAGTFNQRVRLPRETLANRSANCIDGTVLVASLLEAISLNPAIVIVPGHAFAAWETWKNSGQWRYLETTVISTDPFADACATGDATAQAWLAEDQGANTMFKRWSLRDLRAAGITPLE
jgi:hypothetical protein